MSETMIIKLADLVRVVYAVAFVCTVDRRVSVWKNGTRMFHATIDASVTDAEAQALAEAELRSAGWMVAGEWDRPSAEWTEYRTDVLGTEDIVGAEPVALSWTTVEA